MDTRATLTDCTGSGGCVYINNCVILACEEGWGNRYYDLNNPYKSLTPQERIQDGCETRLNLGHRDISFGDWIPGDWGWAHDSRNPEKAWQLVASGAGSVSVVVPIKETFSGSKDMKVTVYLWHSARVQYSLEVEDIGNCYDPAGKNGLRYGGTSYGPNGAIVAETVDLLWNDRLFTSDDVNLIIHVNYLRGATAEDSGEFKLYVGSTEYRVSIDDDESEDGAKPSWQCFP